MQDFMDAIGFAFKEILRTSTMKFAMTSGIIITIIWVILGVLFFDSIVSMNSTLLDLIPFSMIRSNGAWMLSTFLWLQVVLITFALVFSLFGNFIMEKMQKEKYASFSVVVGLFSALFWGLIWFFNGNTIYGAFLKLLNWLPFETIEKGLAYLIGFYIIYTGIIVSMIFVTSMFSTSFLSEIKEKHFPYDRMYDEYEYKTIKKTIADTAVFLVVSILSFPLLFLPIINFIILVGLWIWLMRDTLAYDTTAFVFGEVNKEKLKEYKTAIWGISFAGALFNFVPVFNVFGPYFTELAMFYYFKEKRI